MALALPLRNRLAELVVEAFDEAEARGTLAALARACAGDEALPDEGDRGRLLALGWFEAAGPGRLRLRGAYRPQRARLGERAGRAAALLAAWRDRPDDGLARLLGRAAALADARLFFEAHELLEPAWFRAEEPLRTALQGLIQVAVACHHLEEGNPAGARSLLREGHAKVEAAGAALPVETAAWLRALRGVLAALDGGAGERPELPAWPRPGEARPPGDRVPPAA